MKKRNKNKIEFNTRGIIGALVVTLIILFIPLVKTFNDASWSNILVAMAVTELGTATLWWIWGMGLFSTSRYGVNRASRNAYGSKYKKPGAYVEPGQKAKYEVNEETRFFKKKDSPLDYDKKKPGWYHGPLLMGVIGIVFLIASIITMSV